MRTRKHKRLTAGYLKAVGFVVNTVGDLAWCGRVYFSKQNDKRGPYWGSAVSSAKLRTVRDFFSAMYEYAQFESNEIKLTPGWECIRHAQGDEK